MTISEFLQDRISAAHIMVVGCGALGNEVLKNLALSGVGHIIVVDFDVVEQDNLPHSVLFSLEDAEMGRLKVDVVANSLHSINPRIEVTSICGDIAYDVGLGILREMDVVIGCVDNRWARYCINRLCMRAGIPWVDGGIDGLEGTARVFVPEVNCYACNLGVEGLRDLAYRMPCAGTIRRNIMAGKAPTTSITASVIGAIQVQEALKLLHPEALKEKRLTSLAGHMFCFEGQHLTTRMVAFKGYDTNCPVHEQWSPIEKTSMTTTWTVNDTLTWIRKHTNEKDVSIQLVNDCFVDKVTLRSNDTQFTVMKPGRAVSDIIAKNEQLSDVPLRDFYQHEYHEVDEAFPYQHITLAALGIPDREVLLVRAVSREFYFELSET